ncbi:MAG TPA: FHA domain-containing protein [Fimbriimonadaceae bacterium]|nr:FHA domain-containing protein [Fimbriimonadaceae bacterium]
MGSILFRALIGGVAGTAAWALTEPMAGRAFDSADWGRYEMAFVVLLGALIGVALGAYGGWLRGSRRHTLVGAAIALLFGAVGASIGYGIGGWLTYALYGTNVFMDPTIPVQIKVTARILALTPIGLFVGAAIGASSLTVRQLVVGATGGAIGGAVGGALFDPIGGAIGNLIATSTGRTEIGIVSRAVYAVLMGLGIGLFVGIVDRVTRQAWVRLVLGRNEGKEWMLDAPQNFIGRSERAHVPLFGDGNVMPMHASIQRHGSGYVLVDAGSPIGTGLNGQRVMGSAPLVNGDYIQVGPFNLQFMVKAGRPGALPPERVGGGATPISVGPAPQAPITPQPTASVAVAQPVAQPSSVEPPKLVIESGPGAGRVFPIDRPTEIGREAAIAIPDPQASRRHAAIAPGPGGPTLTDLNSTNGTYVNGTKITSVTLRPGDTITIGSTTIRVS